MTRISVDIETNVSITQKPLKRTGIIAHKELNRVTSGIATYAWNRRRRHISEGNT